MLSGPLGDRMRPTRNPENAVGEEGPVGVRGEGAVLGYEHDEVRATHLN